MINVGFIMIILLICFNQILQGKLNVESPLIDSIAIHVAKTTLVFFN